MCLVTGKWGRVFIITNMNLSNFLELPCITCLTLTFWQSVLDGYNGTIMAYGQTGTGKTYTLGRLGEEDNAARGIMVRAMEDILADISLETDSVSVSYLQVLCSEKDFGITF